MSTNKQFIASVRRITRPTTMLHCILENESFFGYDPYYREIRDAIINQAEKVLANSKRKPNGKARSS